MHYDWNWGVVLEGQSLRLLLRGFWTSIQLTAWCLVFGMPSGFLLGVLGSSAWSRLVLAGAAGVRRGSAASGVITRVLGGAARLTSVAVIDIVRAIPLLLLILFVNYAMPVLSSSVVGGHPSPFAASTYYACVVAMSINLAAFVGDVVRGAIDAVPRGAVLAARAVGMTPRITLRRIVIPEVVREILPSIILLAITMFKMSTLASVVAVYEVLHSADAIIQRTYRPLEVYAVVCAFFVVTIVPASAVGRLLERTTLFKRRS